MSRPALAPRDPPVESWRWDAEETVDGVVYPATTMSSPLPEYTSMIMLHGLPDRYRDEMLIVAQGSPTPHAWRVAEPLARHEVGPATMEQARALFRRDVDEYGNTFLTFLAVREDGTRDLIGCAAARRRISPAYESPRFVVLGRLLAVPELRGKGLGVHFHLAFFACSQTLCGTRALGNFMPTDTEQTRRLCRRAVENGMLDMVPAGRKRWKLIDRVLDVEVFLAFYPDMKDWLRARAQEGRARLVAPSSSLVRLWDLAEAAVERGYEPDDGARLGEALRAAEGELLDAARDPDVALVADFLLAARAMGTLEP